MTTAPRVGRCGHKSDGVCADTPALGLHPRPPRPGFALRETSTQILEPLFLALTHILTWPDLLVDEAQSLCSGMWGNQSPWGRVWDCACWALCPRVSPQLPCLE